MKYVDSNVFIYPLIYDATKVAEARISKSVLLQIMKGELKACTSCLTWDEIVYIVSKVSGLDDARKAGANFLLFPNLKILLIDSEIVGYAQGLIEKYNLKPRDAIHAASAIKNQVKEIVSNDSDFDDMEELKRVHLDDVAQG